MNISVLSPDLVAVDVIDTFESFIWAERFCGYGDFEICTPAEEHFGSLLLPDRVLCIDDSDYAMIIENIQIPSDVENGDKLIVSGRSLESILERRVVWPQTTLTGNFQNGIEQLLNNHIILPTDPNRKIDNFIFEASDDPVIIGLTVDIQFTGDVLYDAIVKLCASKNIGFKVTLTEDKMFKFKLYSGVDRSYEQIDNPYVVFSPSFENLSGSNYLESASALKTFTIVAGEGTGSDRKSTTVGGGIGILRRELFTDARDLSQKVNGATLSDAEYLAKLEQRGLEKLLNNQYIQSFEGPVQTFNMFKYGEDFFMGDIVQIANEYGAESRVRVVELIRSENQEGINVYPTFSTVSMTQVQTGGSLTPGSGAYGGGDTAAAILEKLKTVDGVGSGLDADKICGKNLKLLANQFSWGTSESVGGWYKIRIKSAVSNWMLLFKLMIYQGYEIFEVNISGYSYGTNHWYTPKATLVSKTIANTIKFGFDTDGVLWVAFQGSSYTGISISNMANGFYQITEAWCDVFEVVYQGTLTGTEQASYSL